MIDNRNEVMDDEQARDLAALTAQADDAPMLPGQAAPEPVQARQPLEKEIASLLKMVSQTLKPILPTVAQIYSDETCDAVGGVLAPVCKKHGWLQDGIGGRYGEEIMCLIIVGPIAYATTEAARHDLSAKKPQAQKTLGGAGIENVAAPVDTDPGQKSVTIGAPIAT